jgi:excisionase family DNA binding protein
MMLTTPETAARLGVTPGRVRQMIHAGQLPATKAGRDWLIDENDLQLVAARKKPGRPGREDGMNFYAKSEGRHEALYVFRGKKARDAFCRQTPGVFPIASEHYRFLTDHAAERGGQYTVHDMRGN